MIIVSRIIHVKVDRRLNVTNKFKYQRRLSSRLAIVMFRGTPCIYPPSQGTIRHVLKINRFDAGGRFLSRIDRVLKTMGNACCSRL